MTRTVGALLDERAAALRGREREREALLGLLAPGGPLVAMVQGIAGVGKSSLLRAFAADARRRGADVVQVDGGVVEPSQRGVLDALARAARCEPTLDAVAAALAADRAVVVIVDEYDRLGMVDAWVCRTLVPALPANVRVVLAGRAAPTIGWLRGYGELVRTIVLAGLAPEDAEAFLRAAGASAEEAAWLNQRARGHPLTLQLLAAALDSEPAPGPEDGALAALDEVARTYLDGLDAATRRVLEAASVTRRTTLALLEAMLPDEPAHEAFARLRGLPLVVLRRDGLVLHEAVRESIASLLRAREPARHRRYRTAAWRVARADLRRAGPLDAWRATADVLYLVDDPLVRDFFFAASHNDHAVERARPEDWPAIAAIAEQQRAAVEVELVEAWWEIMPSAFTVSRDAEGEVSGFCAIAERRSVTERLVRADPMLRRWREHLRSDPVPRGQRVLFDRFLEARQLPALDAGGPVPSSGRAALLLDLKRQYVQLRPHLRRVYAPSPLAASAYGLCALTLGYVPVPGERPGADGIPYGSVVLELGPESVDGWLAGLVARLLLIDAEGPIDVAARELVLDGRRVPLTPLELGVLRYLHDREGRVVTRDELLRDVWGHRWTGGSNVVDVVVSALRRKLADRAGALETVRGAGYRLGSLL